MSGMQDSLRELYQEVIFDHNRNPRNYRPLPAANHHADGHNPLCGDQLTVYLQVEDGIVRDASFVGHGCAISTASASLMTEAVKGKDFATIAELRDTVQHALTEQAQGFTADDAARAGPDDFLVGHPRRSSRRAMWATSARARSVFGPGGNGVWPVSSKRTSVLSSPPKPCWIRLPAISGIFFFSRFFCAYSRA